MGRLSALANSLVYVDANTIIYTVERIEPYTKLLDPFWQEASDGAFSVCTSALTALETLIRPLRFGDGDLEFLFRQMLFFSPDLRLIDVTRDVIERAARLRAQVAALRTPDALHAATAFVTSADLFVTNDVGFTQVPGLPVILLRDLLTP